MTEASFARPVALDRKHRVESFDCGKPPLNDFLKRYALPNQSAGSARTYVLLAEKQRVVAYYSLAPGAVAIDDAPDRVVKGLARHSIPVILMARFAVAVTLQGQGIGRALFLDALARALHGTEEIGGRVFFVKVKDDEAAAFYRRFNTEPSPSNSHRLFLLFKDVRKALGVG